jgi:hypothetical protein
VRGSEEQVLTRWPEDHLISLRLPYCCFVFSGEADFRIGDAVLQCPQGHGILIPPGTPLSDGASPHWERDGIQNAESDILWMKFYPFGVECHTCHTRGQEHYGGGFGERSVVSDRQFFVLCELLADEMNYRREGFETLSSAYLLAILALLLRHLEQDEDLPHRKLPQDLAARGQAGKNAAAGAKLYREQPGKAAYTTRNRSRFVYFAREAGRFIPRPLEPNSMGLRNGTPD